MFVHKWNEMVNYVLSLNRIRKINKVIYRTAHTLGIKFGCVHGNVLYLLTPCSILVVSSIPI